MQFSALHKSVSYFVPKKHDLSWTLLDAFICLYNNTMRSLRDAVAWRYLADLGRWLILSWQSTLDMRVCLRSRRWCCAWVAEAPAAFYRRSSSRPCHAGRMTTGHQDCRSQSHRSCVVDHPRALRLPRRRQAAPLSLPRCQSIHTLH